MISFFTIIGTVISKEDINKNMVLLRVRNSVLRPDEHLRVAISKKHLKYIKEELVGRVLLLSGYIHGSERGGAYLTATMAWDVTEYVTRQLASPSLTPDELEEILIPEEDGS